MNYKKDDIEHKARALIASSRAEVALLLINAKSESEQVIARSIEKGRKQGRRNTKKFRDQMRSFEATKTNGFRREAIAVAFSTAREVLSGMATNGESAQAITRVILNDFSEAQAVKLKTNSADLVHVLALKNELEFDVVKDPHVDIGGVIALMDFGTVDAQIDTQIEELTRIAFS